MENLNIQGQPPKNWLVESILATIICCPPFGLIGIINAAKVEQKFFAGATDEALKASQDAAKWTKIAFFSGLVAWIIFVAIYAIFIAAVFKAVTSPSGH